MALPPGSHRGGVLTMASVLKVTANGTTTSPVAARGVGPGSHPRHAAAAAARQCAGDRARHSRRHDDPRAIGQAPLRSHRVRAATADRPARLCAGEAST